MKPFFCAPLHVHSLWKWQTPPTLYYFFNLEGLVLRSSCWLTTVRRTSTWSERPILISSYRLALQGSTSWKDSWKKVPIILVKIRVELRYTFHIHTQRQYTFQQLLDRVQASEAELSQAIRSLNAGEIDGIYTTVLFVILSGYIRTLDLEFAKELIEVFALELRKNVPICETSNRLFAIVHLLLNPSPLTSALEHFESRRGGSRQAPFRGTRNCTCGNKDDSSHNCNA